MKYRFVFLVTAMLILTSSGAALPGIPRDSNTGNTGNYDSTRIEAQLVVPVREGAEVVHFIRDNNDPRVITKTYVLKNIDAYAIRDYLRQMVQSKRVGNTTQQQAYPGNTSQPDIATVSAPELNPATAQPGYAPQLQLGSNTAVECLKYADGTGLLIVSAEDYRFEDQQTGIGIDSLVAMMDNMAQGPISYGSQMFLYMPKFVPARNLMPLIENVGMNISDVTELWQGSDIVAYDPDLNWLIFDVANYSCDNIAAMLAKYDVPVPQVRLKITVYEVYRENDDRIGLDFLAWKNNDGADLFSAGGRYRNNWSAAFSAGRLPDRGYGSERTSFYNFNPKWNTRYLDFLVSRGKAQIAHSGELCIRNNTPASLSRTTQIFYSDNSTPVTGSADTPDLGVGAYQLLSRIIGAVSDTGSDVPVGKGNAQVLTASASFGFTMTVKNASVNLDETRFDLTLENSSLIGFTSAGSPRIAPGNTVNQQVSLPHGTNRFVIGGLNKEQTVRSTTGIPYLCRIPWIGYLFGTDSTSIKHSDLIVVGECTREMPNGSSGAASSKRWTR
ncbi:MAG: hypothetical protein J6R85_04405 [Lentisphaeria bacterium]|nr:hypothetical protein [Lentisphaeria bacterium]